MSSNDTQPHDLAWIKTSLQSAIELEYSTLPLYLSALFSLEVQNYTVYNLLRSVAMEEMVHLAIAANALAALGGTPHIKAINIRYPVMGLPGGAEPDLQAGLAQFSKKQLQAFMRIEMPQSLLCHQNRDDNYPTIASFYLSIRQAILDNADACIAAIKQGGGANQVGDNIGFNTFQYRPGSDPIQMLCDGIDEILQQGEGASSQNLMADDQFEYEESHYAKIASLYYGAAYQQPVPAIELNPVNEPAFFKGKRIGWPKVINTLAVPSDGYAKILNIDPNGAEVNVQLQAFDSALTSILSELDSSWNGTAEDSWKTLGAAVHNMVDLRVLSCFNIMRHQIPNNIIEQLETLYPSEITRMRQHTDLSQPVFYGPRFINNNS